MLRKRTFFFVLAFLTLFLLLFSSSPSLTLLPSQINGAVQSAFTDWRYAELHCDCEGERPVIRNGTVSSLCSTRSTLRGPGQRVVSYCLFGSKRYTLFGAMSRGERAPVEYENLIPRLIENVKVQYPGKKGFNWLLKGLVSLPNWCATETCKTLYM